jgi:hypothetical protein
MGTSQVHGVLDNCVGKRQARQAPSCRDQVFLFQDRRYFPKQLAIKGVKLKYPSDHPYFFLRAENEPGQI